MLQSVVLLQVSSQRPVDTLQLSPGLQSLLSRHHTQVLLVGEQRGGEHWSSLEHGAPKVKLPKPPKPPPKPPDSMPPPLVLPAQPVGLQLPPPDAVSPPVPLVGLTFSPPSFIDGPPALESLSPPRPMLPAADVSPPLPSGGSKLMVSERHARAARAKRPTRGAARRRRRARVTPGG